MLGHRPFPGLRPFDSRDRNFFFGRQEQIYSLYRLADRSRFVAVVGSSGSGKSSLVRAGLLPLLDEETREQGARSWQYKVMHPGGAPITQLTAALASLAIDDDPAIAAVRQERIEFDLRRSSFGIADALAKIESLSGFSLLLVVDQFEELFRYAKGETADVRGALEARQSRDEAVQFVQLLLEGSRATGFDVHIVITMRSDFIGDCAQFHGLPEAVSATQFLVPSLTRDQLEEAIRKPLEKVGDSIEPALVESLLNDSSDELDQLPVLQHCLLRLWERAGVDLRPDTVHKGLPQEDLNDVSAAKKYRRHLTIDHYVSIGRISGALSQHADEILSELSGLELAVEQAFRALAEIDKESRAIRRALPFRQLFDETGVPDNDLRRVLDRFRAEDCSFLVSSPSDVPSIEADTRIDVGHEALLRRWERVSGTAAAIESSDNEAGGAAKIGWLRDEERDGLRYQGILSLLDHEGSEVPTLPFGLVNEYWTWWKTRPRTAAWAARYGGGFERVEQLFEDSLAALRAEEARRQREEEEERARAALQARLDKITRVASVVVSGLLIIAVGLGIMFYHQAQIAERNYELALQQTNSVAQKISDDLSRGAVSVHAAKELLATTDETIRHLQDIKPTPQATNTGVNLLFAYSDSLVKLGDFEQALEKARDADRLANGLAATDRTNSDWQILVYGSAFRIGDALANQNKPAEAMEEYRLAEATLQHLIANEPRKDECQQDLSFIDDKIAEVFLWQKDFPKAIAEFETALAIAQKLADKDPANVEWRRGVASTLNKLGNALAKQPQPDLDGALARFDDALGILTNLATQHPDNDVVLSNLAHAHNGKANLLIIRGDHAGAITEFQSGIKIQKQLVDKDPGNALWLSYVAPDYRALGDLLKSDADLAGAITQYLNEVEIRQRLVNKDPNNEQWQRNLQSSKRRIESLRALEDGVGPPQPP
jgi:tetratricopeptide (TPR) repeat protein